MAKKKLPSPAPAPPPAKGGHVPRLKVRTFGPLRQCDLPVHEMLVLIGEQASGKSTLAKLIYFFQALPELVEENADRLASGPDPFENWIKLVRQRFMDSFGTTKHLPEFAIEYHYSGSVWLRLTQEAATKHVRIEHEPGLQTAILHRIEVEAGVVPDGKASSADPLRVAPADPAQGTKDAANRKIRELTGCEAERVFVPSSRSLLSVLSTDLLYSDIPDLDPLVARFVRRIAQVQRAFSRSLEDQLENALHATLRDVPVEQARVETAIRIARSVLKGSYVYDRGRERIELADGQHVYLRFASSGQQEALWIVLLLFSIILHSTPATVIMEEIEAHLFPFAQRDLTEMVVLAKNLRPAPGMPRNAAVLTTHSPYVLAALNNLLYAHQVGTASEGAGEKVEPIVDRQIWLDPAAVGVWFVEKGEIRSIMDPDLHLIQAEEIDGVSSALRSTFDAIAEVESA